MSGKIVHLDFRTAQWPEVASALCDFSKRACLEGAYAYISLGDGHPLSLIEKLIAELDIEDYACVGPQGPPDPAEGFFPG